VLLPEMNGIDLAIHFGKHFPKCKILLISGQTETTDLLESAHARGDHFEVLAKPFHPTDLLTALDRLSSVR
jgi:CheY-like chemotaxis protein